MRLKLRVSEGMRGGGGGIYQRLGVVTLQNKKGDWEFYYLVIFVHVRS